MEEKRKEGVIVITDNSFEVTPQNINNSFVPYDAREKDKDRIPVSIIEHKKRKDREPQVGDIYLHESCGYWEAIKLTERESIEREPTEHCPNPKPFVKFHYQRYDISKKNWKDAISYYSNDYNHENPYRESIDSGTLKQYYSLVLEDFDALMEKAEKIYSGEIMFEDLMSSEQSNQEQSYETALSTNKLSSEQLLEMRDNLDTYHNKILETKKCVEILISKEKMRMEMIKKDLDNKMMILHKQIKQIMKVIQMIELYCGINEEIFQITEGTPASEDEPINIRQMILYMDEEVAVSDFYGHVREGFDYTNIEDFYKWLSEPVNRDQVIPEQKCIVIMKPRRQSKTYYNSSYSDQAARDRWNRESYVIIRNGDNLYSIFTENLYIYDKVFPNKKELQELINEMSKESAKRREDSFSFTENKFENIINRSRAFAILVQGLIDRSDVFKSHDIELSIFKNDNGLINFIYDDENILTNGRMSFKDWQKEINQSIGKGSRVVLSMPLIYGYGYNRRSDFSDRWFKFYTEYPDVPDDGLYQVEEKKYDAFVKGEKTQQTALIIRYFAGGQYYQYGEGYKDRKLKTVFKIYNSDEFLLNYDRISLDDINYYINSRQDRIYYMRSMNTLKKVKEILLAEMEKEKDFITMMSWEIQNETKVNEEVAKKMTLECIDWWKFKNIWKRPITKDDAKAYRMILSEAKRRLK